MRPPKFRPNRYIGNRRVMAFPTFSNMADVRHLELEFCYSGLRRMRRSCRSWKKHLSLTTLTCLSSDRSDESWTPRTRTSSDWATWAPPSVKARPKPGIFDKLCLVPVHISSVLSMLSLSRLAAIHCSIAVTHCWTLVTADCTFSGLQLIIVSERNIVQL